MIEEHRDRIVVSTEAGEWTILRKDIQEVFYDDPERNYLFIGNEALGEENFSLAQMFFRRALQIKPEFIEAQNALNRLADVKKKSDSRETYPDPVSALNSRWGITLESKKEFCAVQSVKPGSAAEKGGIAAGDSVVAVWGYSAAFVAPQDLAAMLLGPAGTPVRLTIARSAALSQADKKLSWSGMTLDMKPQGLTVIQVDPKSAAENAGLLPMDRIVEIDGFSTRYMPLGESRKRFKETPQPVSALIQRDLLVKRE